MGPIALFVVVVLLPLGAIVTVGALWASTWIADLPLLILPLTVAGAVAGAFGGAWIGRRLRARGPRGPQAGAAPAGWP